MNYDQVSEVYKGNKFKGVTAEDLKERVDWVVEHAQGEKILDIGCSQGIVAILAARANSDANILGVDVNEVSIDYARSDLELEADSIKSRVAFSVTNILEEDVDGLYDCILVGEVIEHFENPELLLSRVSRFLDPDGRVVLTTPFGYLPHDDHFETYYFSNFLALVEKFFCVEVFEIVGKRICTVLTKKSDCESMLKEVERLISAEEKEFLVVEKYYMGLIDKYKRNYNKKIKAIEQENTVLARDFNKLQKIADLYRSELAEIKSKLWFRLYRKLKNIFFSRSSKKS